MSQQKVDQKKLDKKNRKAIVKKRKIEEFLSMAIVAVIGLAIIGWVGFSIYTKVTTKDAADATYEYFDIDTSAIQDYLSSLSE